VIHEVDHDRIALRFRARLFAGVFRGHPVEKVEEHFADDEADLVVGQEVGYLGVSQKRFPNDPFSGELEAV
jgi:hypothetical protein